MTLVPIEGVNWYVRFNPGFTVLSLFVPLIALAVAFYFLDMSVFTAWRACVSGILSGGAIGLMHYSASFQANLNVTYTPAQTVVSIIIAMLAATVALTLFFRFKSHWNDAWYKRVICAGVLAVSVAGMHYVGVWGTSFTLRPSQVNDMSALLDNNNNTTAIAISIMCVVVFLLSVAVAVSDLIVAKAERQAARKVVVCSLTFNKQGQLLVREDGTLPMVMIETPLHQSEVIDALDKRQPTFQWLYAVSWNWAMVSSYLPAIAARLRPTAVRANDVATTSALKGRRMRAMKRLFRKSDEQGGKGPSVTANAQVKLADFRDRVIDAADSLAEELDVPFDKIGVLYDSVMQTGTRLHKDRRDLLQKIASADRSRRGSKPHADEETSPGGLDSPPSSIARDEERNEEGAMLFLVRELNTASDTTESEARYLERGYRLTETRFLAGHLADRYAAPKEEMEATLTGLKMYAKRGICPVVQPNGVYVGLFGVRASTTRLGGLEVLVYEFARHQIPAYRLPQVAALTPPLRYFITLLNEMTLEDAMASCETESRRSSERLKSLTVLRSSREISRNKATNELDEEDEIREEAENLNQLVSFQNALFIALEALSNSLSVYSQLKSTARLSSDVLQVPSSLDDATEPAEMIVVRAVLPDHYNTIEVDEKQTVPTDEPQKSTPFMYTPYPLFTKSQMMLLRGHQACEFERSVSREMNRRYPPPSQTFAIAKDDDNSVSSFDKVASPVSANDEPRPSDVADSDNPYTTPKLLRGLLPFKLPGGRDSTALVTSEMQERRPMQARPLSTIPESPQIHGQVKRFSGGPRSHARRSGSPSLQSHHSSIEMTTTTVSPAHSQPETLTGPDCPSSPQRPRRSDSGPQVRPSGSHGRVRYAATSPDLSLRMAEDGNVGPSADGGIRQFLESKAHPDPRWNKQQAAISERGSNPDVPGKVSAANPVFQASAHSSRVAERDIDTVAYLSGPHALPYPFILKDGAATGGTERNRPHTAPEYAETGHTGDDLHLSPSTQQQTQSSIDVMPDYARLHRTRPSTSGGERQRMLAQTSVAAGQPQDDSSRTIDTTQSIMTRSPADNRSAAARYRADGWADRHLYAVERGPGGQSLLGVDY